MLGTLIRTVPALVALGLSPLAATTLTSSAAAEPLVPVSPGATDRAMTIGSPCPTFSWATTAESDTVVLEVVEAIESDPIDPAGETDPRTVLEVALPGGARSWTPSGDQCLEPGATYVWFVRNTIDGRPVDRSEGRFFQVWEQPPDARPSAAEVAWAKDVLQRSLDRPTPSPDGEFFANGPIADPADLGPETADVPRPKRAPSGIPAALRVKGRLEVKELQAVANPPDAAGNIIAEGNISAPSGAMVSPRATVTGGFEENDLYTLRATGLGEVTVCRSGAACDTGSAPAADGAIRVGVLGANDAIVVDSDPGGMTVAGPYTWHGTGGGGFFEVPSATNVNVDDNYSSCPGGGVAVGVRLWETDNNQIGIQVRCSQ